MTDFNTYPELFAAEDSSNQELLEHFDKVYFVGEKKSQVNTITWAIMTAIVARYDPIFAEDIAKSQREILATAAIDQELLLVAAKDRMCERFEQMYSSGIGGGTLVSSAFIRRCAIVYAWNPSDSIASAIRDSFAPPTDILGEV